MGGLCYQIHGHLRRLAEHSGPYPRRDPGLYDRLLYHRVRLSDAPDNQGEENMNHNLVDVLRDKKGDLDVDLYQLIQVQEPLDFFYNQIRTRYAKVQVR